MNKFDDPKYNVYSTNYGIETLDDDIFKKGGTETITTGDGVFEKMYFDKRTKTYKPLPLQEVTVRPNDAPERSPHDINNIREAYKNIILGLRNEGYNNWADAVEHVNQYGGGVGNAVAWYQASLARHEDLLKAQRHANIVSEKKEYQPLAEALAFLMLGAGVGGAAMTGAGAGLGSTAAATGGTTATGAGVGSTLGFTAAPILANTSAGTIGLPQIAIGLKEAMPAILTTIGLAQLASRSSGSSAGSSTGAKPKAKKKSPTFTKEQEAYVKKLIEESKAASSTPTPGGPEKPKWWEIHKKYPKLLTALATAGVTIPGTVAAIRFGQSNLKKQEEQSKVQELYQNAVTGAADNAVEVGIPAVDPFTTAGGTTTDGYYHVGNYGKAKYNVDNNDTIDVNYRSQDGNEIVMDYEEFKKLCRENGIILPGY